MDLDTIGGLLRAEGVRIKVAAGVPKFVNAPSAALKEIVLAHRDLIVAIGDGTLPPPPPPPPWKRCEACKAHVRRYADCNAGQICDQFPCPERTKK